MKRLFLFLLVILISAGMSAKVDLPSVFGDNMVLQRNASVAFWGTAKADSKVTIRPSWTKSRTVAVSDADGKWSARVETPEAGGPYTVTISDGEKLVLENVLIGEVINNSNKRNLFFALPNLYC